MARPVSLSAPYSLFPLSLPLHQTRAKDREGDIARACYTAPVDSRKRKRSSIGSSEIAAAVDGEGVNIYDITASQPVSSYAVPPTTKFSCAPVSIIRHSSGVSIRRTYAATIAPKRQLLCWEENSNVDEVKHWNHACGRLDAVYLRQLGKVKDDGALLAVYNDGSIRSYSQDLKEEKWAFDGSSKGTVVHASAHSAQMMRNLFKERADVTELGDDLVLFIAFQTGTEFVLEFHSIPRSSTSKPRNLLSIPLKCPVQSERPAKFATSFTSGTLHQLHGEFLVTYDLTGTSPTQVSSIRVATSADTVSSLVRISASTVLVATGSDVALYDTTFSSRQAQTHSEPSFSGLYLTTYLPEMSLVLGYTQTGIVGLQCERARGKPGLLIDSISLGIGEGEIRESNGCFQELQQARKAGDVARFETIFARYVGYEVDPQTNGINGVEEHQPNGTEIVLKPHPSAIPEAYWKPLTTSFTSAVLSLIFTLQPSPDGEKLSLDPSFFPWDILTYLLDSGNVSALCFPASCNLTSTLATFDSSLKLLTEFLTSMEDLSLPELCRAVQIGMEAPATNDIISQITHNEVLRLSLLRLHRFPAQDTVSALRSHFPGNSLHGFIHLLNYELAGTEDLGIDDIGILADLLISAVDALGVGGIVLGDSGTGILDILDASVASAIEDSQSSASLLSLLDGAFHYAKWDSITSTSADVDATASDYDSETSDTSHLSHRRRSNSHRNRKRRLQKTADSGETAIAFVPAMKHVGATKKVKRRLPFSVVSGTHAVPLPLRRRELVDPLVGVAPRVTEGEKKGRRAYWRDGLGAGVYSVETMFV